MIFTLEADGRYKVLVRGDRVKTLPVSQLPNLTGVVTTSGCQVIPEKIETKKSFIHFAFPPIVRVLHSCL